MRRPSETWRVWRRARQGARRPRRWCRTHRACGLRRADVRPCGRPCGRRRQNRSADCSLNESSTRWSKYAVPPHHRACYEEHGWNDTKHGPGPLGFDPGEASEVQLGQPLERDVAAPGREALRIERLEEVDDVHEGVGKDEIDPADGPEQHDNEGPEADRAVEIPVDALPALAPPHREAAPPLVRPLPPDDRAGET